VERVALLYDSDCGFCRRALAGVLVWDRHGRLRPVSLRDPEADELLADMPPERRAASWHLVTPDGRVHSAGAGFPPLLRLLPGGRPLAALAAAFPGATERGYRVVARNRGRLGRALRSGRSRGRA
jgi:predicted DCC family thiol-disulfide oxidoreductase YuxK